MDKFLALTEEKRLTILNAAFQCFGKFGYEKASINDIAVAAHISKAPGGRTAGGCIHPCDCRKL